MKKNQSYYGYKKNYSPSEYGRYTPSAVGKIAVAITTPSAIIALVSALIAFFALPDVLIVTIIMFVISFVGSIVILVDIVVHNHKQKKKSQKTDEPKELDIRNIVHLLIGIGVGVIIGYLIWGIK